MRDPEPIVLVVAHHRSDAEEVARALHLRAWSDQIEPGRSYGGIVYVDGWDQTHEPLVRIARRIQVARMSGAHIEIEQRSPGSYFTDHGALRAQAILANEREARRPHAATMVAPERMPAVTGTAYTLRRRWWHRLIDWLRS